MRELMVLHAEGSSGAGTEAIHERQPPWPQHTAFRWPVNAGNWPAIGERALRVIADLFVAVMGTQSGDHWQGEDQ